MSQKPFSPLLKFPHIIGVKHYLPGRVRFSIKKIVDNKECIEEIHTQLPKITGVKSVEANIISGSVLIFYDPKQIQCELLAVVLIRLLNLEQDMQNLPASLISREIKTLSDALNQAIYSSSSGVIDLWTLLPLIIGIWGSYQVIKHPQNRSLGMITLLWWVYSSLLKRER